MTPRHDKPARKKDSVRYVVISPKAFSPLSFSDRLLDKANLTFSGRVGATLIAGVCICAGVLLIGLGVRDRNVFAGLPGLLTVLYGFAWARVACEGRLRGGRLGLNPWRRE